MNETPAQRLVPGSGHELAADACGRVSEVTALRPFTTGTGLAHAFGAGTLGPAMAESGNVASLNGQASTGVGKGSGREKRNGMGMLEW